MQKEKPVSKKDFERTINIKKKARKYETASFITRAKYNKLLQQVKTAKAKNDGKLEPKIAKLVKKYDVITADGVERLAVANSNNKVIYVSKDELFSVISQVHLETNHGTLSEMMKSLKSKYKNVSSEATTAYLKLCQKCCSMRTKTRSARKAEIKEEDESKENKEAKVKKERRKISTKSKEGGPGHQKRAKRKDTGDPSSEQVSKKIKSYTPRRSKVTEATKPFTMGARTPQRIDFIEMESCKDYEYNFIVVLRESTTKFVHLRPLRSHSVRELADILKSIFICFGTPSVLRTSNPDFIKDSVNVLLDKCPTLPTDIQIEATEEAQFFADIETLMLSWVVQNSNERWHAGLRFVQYIANLTYNKEIGKTPFEAMFGRKGKLDVSSLNLPLELLDGIRTEEDSEEERDVDINEMLEVEINDDSPVGESTSCETTSPLRTNQGSGLAQL